MAQNVGSADGWLENEHRIERLLAGVGLAGCGELLSKQLPGGTAQHAAITHGLYKRPRVLLLGEPFSAIDAFTRVHLQNLLRDAMQNYGISVLLATHDLDEAFYLTDRMLLMGGRPGHIRREFHIPLARPRDRRAIELAYLRGEVPTEIQRVHVL